MDNKLFTDEDMLQLMDASYEDIQRVIVLTRILNGYNDNEAAFLHCKLMRRTEQIFINTFDEAVFTSKFIKGDKHV
jgi:hypothetical protein